MLHRIMVAFAAAVLLAGCATVGSYDPAYFDQGGPVDAAALDGQVLVVTGAAEDGLVFKGLPTTVYASGYVLELPLGVIVREAALRAFGEAFRGGAVHGSESPSVAHFKAVVAPHVIGLTWEFIPDLGLGSAQVRLEVSVSLIDGAGQVAWERRYLSVEDGSKGFSAFENLLSRLAHQAALKAMRQAARELSTGWSPDSRPR